MSDGARDEPGAPPVGRWLAPLVVLLILTPVISVDLQLPAMPVIARDLATSVANVQYSLTLYALAFGILHLVYGPVADRFGRKPFLVGGLALYTAASLYAATASTIDDFVVARLLQGAGAAAAPMLARAVIRDIYGPGGGGRMMGYVMACFGAAAIVMPLYGGVVTEFLGWRAVFISAATFSGVLALFILFLLPETLPARGTNAPSTGRLLRNYLVIARDRRFLTYFATGGLVQSAMFSWIAGSSFVIIDILGRSPGNYSLLYATTVLAFVLSSFLSGRFAERVGTPRLMLVGVTIAAVGGLVALLNGLFGELCAPLLLGTVMVMITGHGITLPQSMAGSIAPFPNMAATAAALFGCLQYLVISVAVVANGFFFDGTAIPMLAVIAASTMLAAVIYYGNYRALRGRASDRAEQCAE